jgi:hypothetical protein
MGMGMQEKLIWVAVLAVVAGIFYISGDGFYRYPCQDPTNWTDPSCQPPICTANKTCPHDLMGDMNVSE